MDQSVHLTADETDELARAHTHRGRGVDPARRRDEQPRLLTGKRIVAGADDDPSSGSPAAAFARDVPSIRC